MLARSIIYMDRLFFSGFFGKRSSKIQNGGTTYSRLVNSQRQLNKK